MIDFDHVPDRKGTSCIKYDFASALDMPEDLLPMWVADMEFPAPAAVMEGLRKRVDHGIFGYTDSDQAYRDAVSAWFEKRFSWTVDGRWIVKTPGVVFALFAAVRAFTEEGDAVMIQEPVYYPFRKAVLENNRTLVNSPLLYRDEHYEMDFGDMEQKIVDHKVRMMILCSPHNPVGRVWTKEELTSLGKLCEKYEVLVVSDEIHCDFVYEKGGHYIFASLSEGFEKKSVICTAPSKTFNLAGLQISNIIIPNQELRRKFRKAVETTGFSAPNLMGITACRLAYDLGEEWLEELLIYLKGNICYVRDFLKVNLPKIKLVEPEGTYLLWLDFSDLGLSQEELDDLIIHKAKLWLDTGTMFGEEGKGFQRINIACPRKQLEEAMGRLVEALDL